MMLLPVTTTTKNLIALFCFELFFAIYATSLICRLVRSQRIPIFIWTSRITKLLCFHPCCACFPTV